MFILQCSHIAVCLIIFNERNVVCMHSISGRVLNTELLTIIHLVDQIYNKSTTGSGHFYICSNL